MDSRLRRFVLVCCVFVIGLPREALGQNRPNSIGAAPAATMRLTEELNRLDAWLGAGQNADRWREYLRIPALRQSIQLGASADPAVVNASLERFTSDAKGLEMPRFVAVRDALRVWRTSLQQGQSVDLPQLALSAGAQHVPVTEAHVAEARRQLRVRAQELMRFLGGGNSSLAQGWQRFLKWNQLQPHLDEDSQLTRRSLGELDQVLTRLRANEPGLELPAFTRLAEAIARYRGLATWTYAARSRDPRQVYEQLLSRLSTELQRHIERPTTETSWQVGRILGLIQSINQSADFVEAVRRRFVQPNIQASVSADFVRRLPDRRLNELRPVRDCILGTTIIGTACTSSEVEYALGTSQGSIALAIHLTGAADSNNNGYNGPVRIKTLGHTNYYASSVLYLSDERFIASPVTTSANTNTRILSINKTGGKFGARLIEKIAWRRAAEQKGQAERISSRHTEARVAREFTETVERDLAKLRQRYEQELRAPLIRRGIQPEYLSMWSSPAEASIETTLALRNQLGADRAPPQPDSGSDLALQVHESAINNYLVLALANARISQQRADVAPALEGDVPNWIKAMSITNPRLAAAAATGAEIVEEAAETIEQVVEGETDEREAEDATAPPFKPYSITLNAEAPVSVRLDDGKLRIRVRAARLVSDDAEYEDWDFIVTYQITHQGDQIILRRTGDIEVFPTGFDPVWDRQLSAQQSGFRSTLAKNMNARARAGQSFPAEIPIQPIRLTRFGTLLLHELQADDGWLTLGWVLPPPTQRPLVPPRPGATLTR